MKIPQSTIDRIDEYVNENPVHQPANATADDINLLKAQMRVHSALFQIHTETMQEFLSHLDAIESKLNQEIQAHSNLLNVQLSTIEELLSRVDTLELGDTKTKNAIVTILGRVSQLETNAGYFNP